MRAHLVGAGAWFASTTSEESGSSLPISNRSASSRVILPVSSRSPTYDDNSWVAMVTQSEPPPQLDCTKAHESPARG